MSCYHCYCLVIIAVIKTNTVILIFLSYVPILATCKYCSASVSDAYDSFYDQLYLLDNDLS